MSDADEMRPPIELVAAGVSVIVDVSTAIPTILHWGRAADLSNGDLEMLRAMTGRQWTVDGVQEPVYPSLVPELSSGWMGTPGIEGHRAGSRFSTRFEPSGLEIGVDDDGVQFIESRSTDLAAEIEMTVRLELLPSGLLRARATVRNTADEGTYDLESLRLTFPVPTEATEILDFAGRHLRERSPQRHPFTVGTYLREGRRGRTGSDATPLLVAGTAGFGFRSGEAWAIHTAWSGNHQTFAELGLPGLRTIGGGEILLPGEVRLAPGESYTSPEIYAAYGDGLDEISGAFHSYLRARASHPRSPRPVVLNTWEAVYFEQDLASLTALAEAGARVGAERFVLDDGWFRNRRSDKAGLGDWQVDKAVWPDGLAPLVETVRGLGMEFGLWFEPEMVNEDSDLARAHPDWILAPGQRLPLRGRHQQVLNLAVPEAYAYILGAISSLVDEYAIDYIKWDHNRDLVEAGDRRTGEARVHEQTLATYRLMDELRRRHPRLEIESCASGGGRVDLGVLQRTDRVWASDSIDALERQQIQRWTGLLLPPELVGSHIGAPTAHTTHRTHSLGFRAGTALFGHLGIEWDLRTADEVELAELTAWVQLYKDERELIHSGKAVRLDSPDSSYWVHGVISAESDCALLAFVAVATSTSAHPGRVKIPGLRPDLMYRLEAIDLSLDSLFANSGAVPAWISEPHIVSGAALEVVGVQAPMLYPEQTFLLRLVAEPRSIESAETAKPD